MTEGTTITTHVLDTTFGAPAANIPVMLHRVEKDGSVVIARGVTNADGRSGPLAPEHGSLREGSYRLCFDVAGYFAATRRASFYNDICIDFTVAADPQHYHVPLLLSPFGYSTYRGS